MGLEHALARARRRHTDFLTDRCTITAPGEGMVYNPDTGRDEPAPGDVRAADVLCKIDLPQAGERVVEVGGEPVTLRTYIVEIDLEQDVIAVEDLVAVTASANPNLVGRTLTVIDVADGSWAGARRVTVRDNLG